MNDTDPDTLVMLTADIVCAHMAHNRVDIDSIPTFITGVHAALSGVGARVPDAEPEPRREPAVPIRQSIHQDHIVCLEDGTKLKMLKRYLMARYNLTPEQYRARWNLPSDYPMVAPDYSDRRRSLAKQIGLGTRMTRG